MDGWVDGEREKEGMQVGPMEEGQEAQEAQEKAWSSLVYHGPGL